jgi:hypothetical protein
MGGIGEGKVLFRLENSKLRYRGKIVPANTLQGDGICEKSA